MPRSYNAGMSTPPLPPGADDDYFLPLCAIFRRFLKRQGLKFTAERAKILDAVLAKQGVFEAEHLMDEMRLAGQRVSKATIYRTLKHLRQANIISEVLISPSQSHYQLTYGRRPVGHLVCVETQQVIEFPCPELEAMRDTLCREHGYDPVSFRFVIYGLSPEGRRLSEPEATGHTG